MKEFFVGLLFLILVILIAGLSIFLWPLLIVLGIVLRFVLFILFIIFAIWLLGKFIVVIIESLRHKGNAK